MSAQLRRRNDRSKLVEQESGRRLYATDLPYEEAMDQTSQKYLDTVKLIKQSEFKKPYREDDYSTMEYGGDWNIPPWKFTPINPGGPDPGCKPKCLGAWGSMGSSWQKCADEKPGCTAYLFECCSRIAVFFSSDLHITGKQYLENDQCVVQVCSSDLDKNSFLLKFIGPDGKIDVAKLTRECCPQNQACAGKCEGCPPPTIGFSSLQMATGGTQVLSHSGGGAGGVYTWGTDFGSFSAPSGNTVTYTAPSSNAECAANPTITLTDCCGHVGTLKLAVNGYSTNSAGYYASETFTQPYVLYCALRSSGTCSWQVVHTHFRCDGYADGGTYAACTSGHNGRACTQAEYLAWGETECNVERAACITALCPDGCAAGIHDTRSAAYKTAGCCPYQLIV